MAYVRNSERTPEELETLRERRREYQRRFRESKGPEYNNGRAKAWRDANPEKVRVINRKGNLRRYGHTEATYEVLLVAQGGRCASCGELPTVGRGNGLYQDHNHATGQNRDLLCHPCNLAVGNVRESVEIAEKLIVYLKKWSIAEVA